MLKNLLKNISSPLVVLDVLKKSGEKHYTKGVTMMGGSGVLITSGTTMLVDGAANKNFHELGAGAFMIIVGSILAYFLSEKIESLKSISKEDAKSGDKK